MEEINLYKLLKFYAKNWAIILVITVMGALSGLVYNSFIQKPSYESDATLLLVNPTNKATVLDVTAINNYVELFKSRRVLEPVIKAQNLDTSYGSLVKSVSATSQKDTQVIKISISTKDPNESTNFVNSAIASFKQEATSLYGFNSVQVVDNASFNATPSNVNKVLQLVIATAAGFVLSIIVMFFVYDSKFDQKKIDRVFDTLKAKIARMTTFVKRQFAKPVTVKKTTKNPKKQAATVKKISKTPIKQTPSNKKNLKKTTKK